MPRTLLWFNNNSHVITMYDTIMYQLKKIQSRIEVFNKHRFLVFFLLSFELFQTSHRRADMVDIPSVRRHCAPIRGKICETNEVQRLHEETC